MGKIKGEPSTRNAGKIRICSRCNTNPKYMADSYCRPCRVIVNQEIHQRRKERKLAKEAENNGS